MEALPHRNETSVKIYTDHKNLTNFTATKALNKRQARWAEFLSESNFAIFYRNGTENGQADIVTSNWIYPGSKVDYCESTRKGI